MKFKKINIVMLISFICFSSMLSETISNKLTITQQLNNLFNKEYILWDYVNVDSVENIFNFNKEGSINDPFNTLDDCIVFTAAEKGSPYLKNGVVGIFKNNSIIWHSDFILPNNLKYSEIFTIFDLTNDGKAEILTTWEVPEGSSYSLDLWIHSWDGYQGFVINDTSGAETSISSTMKSEFNFIDYEGDGIWEIVSYGVDENRRAVPNVHSWNGIIYSLSETIQIDSIDRFFPRNNFAATIYTNVRPINNNYNNFLYNYSLNNKNLSNQAINVVNIEGGMDSVNNVHCPAGWRNWAFGSDVYWEDSTNNRGFTMKYKIKPGQSLSGFSYITNGLPIIADSYLRGYNYCLFSGDDNYDNIEDYLNNSVIIKTIAAKLPPSPFVPQEFLDSILNYNNQSFQLGWVKDEVTYNKYNGYLTNAKLALAQNNNNAARANLQSILTDVDIDSSSTLTSEAYALLKFNTEYLFTQISEAQTYPYLKVNFKDSEGNFILNGSLQYYDAG